MIRLVATILAAACLVVGATAAPLPWKFVFIPACLALGDAIARAWWAWAEARRSQQPTAAE